MLYTFNKNKNTTNFNTFQSGKHNTICSNTFAPQFQEIYNFQPMIKKHILNNKKKQQNAINN